MIYLQTLILSAKTGPERVIVLPSASASRLVHPTVPLVPTVAFPVSIFATAPVNPSFYFWGAERKYFCYCFHTVIASATAIATVKKNENEHFLGANRCLLIAFLRV